MRVSVCVYTAISFEFFTEVLRGQGILATRPAIDNSLVPELRGGVGMPESQLKTQSLVTDPGPPGASHLIPSGVFTAQSAKAPSSPEEGPHLAASESNCS